MELAYELSPGVLRRLRDAARAAAPRECCGILAGRREESRVLVLEAAPVPNIASRPDQFELDPLGLCVAEHRLRSADRMMLGYFHSHPCGPPAPSVADRAGTLWSQRAPHGHLIVTPGAGWALFRVDAAGWRAIAGGAWGTAAQEAAHG